MQFPKLWIVLTMVGLIFESSHALAETRIALVVGNSTYQNVPRLSNPNNDARLMADTLRGLSSSRAGPWRGQSVLMPDSRRMGSLGSDSRRSAWG
jgi:hypothetical protein